MIPRSLLRCFITLLAFALQTVYVAAQLRGNLKHYSTEDGLSHDRVLCMTKDSEGFMWFGTWDGINRFDGHNFIAYKARPGDNSNLKNNKIRNIVEDKLGYLWVKTYDNKVYRFDKRTEKFLKISDSLNQVKFKGLLIDKIIPVSNGDTWLLTSNKGLFCASGSKSLASPHIEQYAANLTGNMQTCGDSINFIYEDSAHRIWIGTKTGLCGFVKKNGKYERLVINNEKSFEKGDSFVCVIEHNSNLYFGTAAGKLVIYNNRATEWAVSRICKDTRINALLFTKNNTLYAATSGKGVALINQADFSATFAGLAGNDNYYSIFEDNKGQLWLQPEKAGVVKFNPSTKSFKLFTQKTDANITGAHTTFTVFNGANDMVWVSMKGGGFGYYDYRKDDMFYFNDEPGSPDQRFSNIITALYADTSGIIWLSGYDGGIYRAIFQPDNFTHNLLVNNPRNKTENEVRAIFEDGRGKLWIGSKSGDLYVIKNGKRLNNVFQNYPVNRIGVVYTITKGKNGTVWLGTKGNGLFKAEPVWADSDSYKLTHYQENKRDKNSLSDKRVYSVLEDSRGMVWVGTFGGGLNLLTKDGSQPIFKNSRNSFKNYPFGTCNVIRHLEEDAQGNIWIATINGLVIFNPKQGNSDNYVFHRYDKVPGDPESLGNNDVQYIHRDDDGNMWIGTFGGGLQKLISTVDFKKKIRFKFFTTANGLPNDIILSITGDNYGDLWITTENGLSKYNPVTGTFHNYDYYDGLPNARFSEAACFKTKAGNILLGCLNGYISFDPGKVYSTRYNANMALTNLQIFNKNVVPGAPGSGLQYPVDQTTEITLKHDQNLLGIEYTVLDYRDSHKILYAYKLEGLDKDWNYVKNQRQATYSNLSPGKYTFRVKSVSHDLFDRLPERSLKITILPPPWLTIWAYIAYFIIAGFALAFARRIALTMLRLRNRVVVEQKLTELKLQFFTNISHELKTPLTLIVSPLEQIAKAENLSVKGREYINVVNKNANRMIRFINQLLDFRKAQSGKMRLKVSKIDVVAMVKHISQYFTEMALEKNISLFFETNVSELYAWVDEEKLDIVIYNLLSNALKFTPSNKKIKLEVVFNGGDYFHINVTDEGVGIPQDKLSEIFELYYEGDHANGNNLKGTGIGLALSKELIINHHGKISAKNNPHEGATFTIELKMGKAHFSDQDADFVDEAQVPGFIQQYYVDKPDTELNVLAQAKPHEYSVLVVEDNSELRRFLCNQLSLFYEVFEASDGSKGLEQANTLLPDLIISDVMMPNLDGIQMLDRLKNNITTSHIPVILLTAKASVDNQIEGLKYGADFYITKPFHTDFILACAENLLKKRKQIYNAMLGDKSVMQLSPGEILITSKDEQLLKETIRIVEEGMADPDFNIDSVAVAIGMGRTTFYKKLKSLTGMAPVEFVRDIRLQRAEQLLSAGEHNISEVAYQTGFSRAGYFSTCFKEKYNLTPSQYIKKEKESTVPGAGH